MRHNHTFSFHVYRMSSSGSSSGALPREYTLPRCGDLSRNKLASPPVLPRCVHIFHFLYLLYLHHPSLSSFCTFGQEFHFTIQNSPPPPFVHNTGSYAKHWGFWHEYADAMMLATCRVSVDPRVRIIQSNQIGSTFLQVGGKFSTFQTSSAHLRQV